MNVREARREMKACVADFRARLAATPEPARQAALVDETNRHIERARKRFKRLIDEKASRRFGFSTNGREGIERMLAEVTAAALAAVAAAVASDADSGDWAT
jgi:hypothetical protein